MNILSIQCIPTCRLSKTLRTTHLLSHIYHSVLIMSQPHVCFLLISCCHGHLVIIVIILQIGQDSADCLDLFFFLILTTNLFFFILSAFFAFLSLVPTNNKYYRYSYFQNALILCKTTSEFKFKRLLYSLSSFNSYESLKCLGKKWKNI